MAKAKEPCSLDGITFDALITINPSYSTETPDFPTEKGYVINDSIIMKPITLEVEAYLTNTPVTWKGNASTTRVQQISEQLESLYFEKKLVTFKTFRKTWKNMAISSLSIPRTQDDGNSSTVKFTLKRINTVSSTYASTSSDFDNVVSQEYVGGVRSDINSGSATTDTSGIGLTSVNKNTLGKIQKTVGNVREAQ